MMIRLRLPDRKWQFTPRALRWLWGIVIAIGLMAIVYRAWETHHREEQLLQAQANEQVGQATLKRLRSLWRGPVTRLDIENAINDGKPFVTQTVGGEERVTWIDPASGYPFNFHFGPGGSAGFSTGITVRTPPQSRFGAAFEKVRRMIVSDGPFGVGIGLWLWIAMLVVALRAEDYYPLLGQSMLMLTVICLFALVARRGYPSVLHALLDDGVLFPGGGMLLVSVFVIAKGRLDPNYVPLIPTCLNCDYNLIGNTSGICPECGSEIPAYLRRRIGNHTEAPATSSPTADD